MICYPKWKYHRTLAACVVADAIAEADLGEGWADTPAAFYVMEAAGEPTLVINAAVDPASPDGAARLALSPKPARKKVNKR